MIQELFRIGPVAISPFGVMMMLAFLAGYFQLAWGFRRLQVGTAEDASALMLWGGLAGIAGGKIYYAVLYHDWRLLLDRSGLVWYGGFLAGAATVLVLLRRRRMPIAPAADALAPALALGYGIGRIGCFLVGDDYGLPTRLPWGVAFPRGLPPTRASWLQSEFGIDLPPGTAPDALLAVHPTQLYETMLSLAIWGVGRRILRRQQRPGTTALVVFSLLAVERFAVELLRVKDDRWWGPFTLAQAISLALLVTMGVLAWRRSRATDAGRAAEVQG